MLLPVSMAVELATARMIAFLLGILAERGLLAMGVAAGEGDAIVAACGGSMSTDQSDLRCAAERSKFYCSKI